MAIRGTYHCDQCDQRFTGWRETDGPYPDCPTCGSGGSWAPQAPAILGNRSKAIDYAQRMAEEDYGLTDMNDNMRPGDVVAKGPSPIQTAEADQITREMIEASNGAPVVPEHLKSQVQNFFQTAQIPAGTSVTPEMAQAQVAGAIQGSSGAAAIARREGADPIALLHKARGTDGGKKIGIEALNIVGKARME